MANPRAPFFRAAHPQVFFRTSTRIDEREIALKSSGGDNKIGAEL
jgi:hypothetical protein